jgi:hypothetical protein
MIDNLLLSAKRGMALQGASRLGQGMLGLGAWLLIVASAEANSRRFGYSYETTTIAKGGLELESWLTWKTQVGEEPGVQDFDLRHEFEYGVTDRLQLSFYFADWNYRKVKGESGRAKFSDVAVEAIYNLTDPNTSAFGSAIYGEIKGSDDFVELEAKLLLQKNINSWVFVYNVGGEFAREDDFENNNLELIQSAGASYQISPKWTVGAELLHEVYVPEANTFDGSGLFFGPNVTWKNEHVSLALTGLWQVTTRENEADFQLRTLFSIDF